MGAVKTILLMVASAIVGIVLFIVGVVAWLSYQAGTGGTLPSISFPGPVRSPGARESTVTAPPAVKERFLGSGGMYSGGFQDRSQVLAAGPGTIAGTVRVDERPAAGVRLRLALNGSVMSQWAEVDREGRYAAAVPYGEYRVDGYELDYNTANAVLGGRTDGPRNGRYHDSDTFTVAEGRPGTGPELRYVAPIVKIGPKGAVSASKPVVLEWRPYPGAASYRVQLTGRPGEDDYARQVQVFDWRDRPVVSGTSLDLGQHRVKLKPGYAYAVEITAIDADGRTLVDSSRSSRTDFRVTE